MGVQISIVLPVYNVEKYVRRCMDSILSQTFQDFEIIVVDDKTQDQSIDIVKSFQEKDSRIKVVRHAFNKGLGAARNTGMQCAEGDYIYFMDSDDWIEKETLEQAFCAITKHQADIVEFGFRKIHTNGTIIFERIPEKEEVLSSSSVYKKLADNCSWVNVWNKLFSKVFLKKTNSRFLDMLYEDIIFTYNFTRYIKKCVVLPKIYYNWNFDPGSSSITTVLPTIDHIKAMGQTVSWLDLNLADLNVETRYKIVKRYIGVLALNLKKIKESEKYTEDYRREVEKVIIETCDPSTTYYVTNTK